MEQLWLDPTFRMLIQTSVPASLIILALLIIMVSED